MTDLNDVIKHAVMAEHDNELSSIVVLMVTKGNDPEIHMAISSPDLHEMNTACDMLKIEILRLISAASEIKKDRE